MGVCDIHLRPMLKTLNCVKGLLNSGLVGEIYLFYQQIESNMISRYFSFILLLGTLLFSSCSPTLSPYTRNMQENFSWTEAEMKGIQFYLSDPIVLYREAKKGDVSVREGKIKIRDGRKVEEIVFEKGTPGVYLFSPKKNHIAVSFEGGGESRYLIFGPNPKFRNKYVLLAKDWNKNSGKITYDGKVYRTPASSAYAGLEVDLDKVQQTDVKSRTAKGRRVR